MTVNINDAARHPIESQKNMLKSLPRL